MITFNGGVLSQQITGVQRYAWEILNEIYALDKKNKAGKLKLRIIIPKSEPLPNDRFSEICTSTVSVARPLWTQLILPFFSKGVLLSLGNVGPLLVRKQILCIHDLNTKIVPSSYSKSFRIYYSIMIPLLARNVKHLVTVSEFSKQVLEEYGIGRGREIHVIPNGHEHVHTWDSTKSFINEKFDISKKFVFMIGSRAAHKNTKVVEAIADKLDKLSVNLVIAGRSGGHFAKLDTIERPNVFFLGPVSDDDLSMLYKHAVCLAFPSLTEGFGLPALEAMALGCPVVCSPVASMPEVCGNAAVYADPNDSLDWFNQIEHILTDERLRNEMKASGLQQASRFSWKSSAEKYLNLLVDD
ncbi:glycosyltransferase family 4 protein [Methylobacterium pseudosasicola]|uniref:Glycosyltransferase involved in cell wall bisynthesis n=1 Tax=Methylobacterium pseudosasicola TaxID=582667 RepID=A0A1I4VIA2_9HYPH|nr:glycosyltransferase family 1 protein [Methylobacterium pseudosasicola]SFN00857.1 Glycosyltransferase involved in cell wall bisynthesis [Methylobacterium pseudosasicola]